MPKEKGLKTSTIVLMICVAIFFDVLQWLLAFIAVDWLAGIFAALTFFVWFALHGISFWKPKRIIASTGGLLIEMFPIIAALPAVTLAVTIVALDSKLKSAVPGLDLKNPDLKNVAKNNVVPFKARESTDDVSKAA